MNSEVAPPFGLSVAPAKSKTLFYRKQPPTEHPPIPRNDPISQFNPPYKRRQTAYPGQAREAYLSEHIQTRPPSGQHLSFRRHNMNRAFTPPGQTVRHRGSRRILIGNRLNLARHIVVFHPGNGSPTQTARAVPETARQADLQPLPA